MANIVDTMLENNNAASVLGLRRSKEGAWSSRDVSTQIGDIGFSCN